MDSDGDGVGDNADAFPNDATETMDSDGDGIGDNADQYPLIDNFLDTDGDTVVDLLDVFPSDQTQWMDADGDSYGDNTTGNNPDAFPTLSTQWSDVDGDGYGDNWGNASWNTTAGFSGVGQFVEGALMSDFCPQITGTSTASGFFGCPDDDADGIPNMFEIVEVIELDTDGDGVDDVNDLCPGTDDGATVDSNGCELVVKSDEPLETSNDAFFSGEVAQSVGVGAILLALFSLLQTNMVAAMLPDAFRWVQVFRQSNKLTKEEKNELTYLQSLVRGYADDVETLREELQQMKSDLTSRFMNNEIKKDTREKILLVIDELITAPAEQIQIIALDDGYFGLEGTIDSNERSALLEEEMAMRDFDTNPASNPSIDLQGSVAEDGYEYIEFPSNSGVWFIRDSTTRQWNLWER
jgi:DNA-directed RNA polymerase subunit F